MEIFSSQNSSEQINDTLNGTSPNVAYNLQVVYRNFLILVMPLYNKCQRKAQKRRKGEEWVICGSTGRPTTFLAEMLTFWTAHDDFLKVSISLYHFTCK